MPMHSHVRQLQAQHSTLVRIGYAHTTCQIIITTFLRQDSADRTERDVLETKTVYNNEYHVHSIKVNVGQSTEFT